MTHAEAVLVNAILGADLTVGELWARYAGLGGDRTRQELQSYLSLETGWGVADHDMLERALVSPRPAPPGS
jgi:hypothetical protein